MLYKAVKCHYRFPPQKKQDAFFQLKQPFWGPQRNPSRPNQILTPIGWEGGDGPRINRFWYLWISVFAGVPFLDIEGQLYFDLSLHCIYLCYTCWTCVPSPRGGVGGSAARISIILKQTKVSILKSLPFCWLRSVDCWRLQYRKFRDGCRIAKSVGLHFPDKLLTAG